MTAVELIKQVAELPQPERTLFEQLFHGISNADLAHSTDSQANWPDFGERLRGIYGDKIAPDSQLIIDDRRSGLAETAGCMSPQEADEFQRVIDEHCERIDVRIKQESEQTKLTTDFTDFTD